MAIVLTEDRGLPKEFKNDFGHYRGFGDDALTGIANIVQRASPWDLLKGIFVDKPMAQAQAQMEVAQMQAQVAMQQEADRAKMLKYGLIAGAGIAGILVIVLVTKPRPAPRAVAGYHRRHKRSRR